LTYIERTIRYFFLMILYNFVLLSPMMPDKLIRVVSYTGLMLFYLYCHIIPANTSCKGQRLKILHGGYDLVLSSIVTFLIETAIYLFLIFKTATPARLLIMNGIICAILLYLLFMNGIIRIFTCSGQLGFFKRIALLLFWWIPGFNLLRRIMQNQIPHINGSRYIFQRLEKL